MDTDRFGVPVAASGRLALIIVAGIGLLLLAGRPAPILAQAAIDEEGCGCHSAETAAWQDSPHAHASPEAGDLPAPTCEGCHGQYVRGHPEKGLMRLSVDSTVCRDCHSDTFDQWEHSMHAQENVQCIGCHLSHSQTLRLTDERLCLSCHEESQEDAFHTSHGSADISCTNCHVTPASNANFTIDLTDGTVHVSQSPTHDFAEVAAASCVDCHVQDIRGSASAESADETVTELMTIANRVPELSARLKTAEKQNEALATVSYVALGLGIGVGAVMGMILVLVIGYVAQRKQQ
jgi:hypothetical protein